MNATAVYTIPSSSAIDNEPYARQYWAGILLICPQRHTHTATAAKVSETEYAQIYQGLFPPLYHIDCQFHLKTHTLHPQKVQQLVPQALGAPICAVDGLWWLHAGPGEQLLSRRGSHGCACGARVGGVVNASGCLCACNLTDGVWTQLQHHDTVCNECIQACINSKLKHMCLPRVVLRAYSTTLNGMQQQQHTCVRYLRHPRNPFWEFGNKQC